MKSITNAEFSHLNRAIDLAHSSSMRQRHGAVIAQGRRILSVGINTFRNNPNIVTNPKKESSRHAEVSAIGNLSFDYDVTMFVARINKQGTPVNSEPCNNCKVALLKAGITSVIYTVLDGYAKVDISSSVFQTVGVDFSTSNLDKFIKSIN